MRHGLTRVRPVVLGLLLALLPSLAPAGEEPPLPDSRLGHRTAPLLLLSRPDVRGDLGLSAEQTASAQRAIREIYLQAAALKKKPNNDETLRARRAIDEAMQEWIETQLSPAQKTRLVQIDLQWEGPSALASRTAVSEALNLSKEQLATLEAAIRRRDASRQQGQADAERILAESSLSCLSQSQRESWKRMLGIPFTPQLAAKEGSKVTR